MKLHAFVLPAFALGAAALLIGPPEPSYGFSKIGGMLGINQRDFRVFNNFQDAAANNNVTEDPNWPGWDGAEAAIWKGHMEWGSGPHGDGTGDGRQPNVGDGGGNFDPAWMGSAASVGNTNHNIVSSLPSGCGGGTLAFTETPISDGWRIRFCDNWNWADGPDGISFNQFDIQSVATHEYGHGLGLGHSGVSLATMFPSASQGSVGPRSIHPDDAAGVQCIYGVADPFKPNITGTSATATDITIYGQWLSPFNNAVWFTNANVTAVSIDPRVIVTGVSSTNGVITLPIPAGAGSGDVLVKIPGNNDGTDLSDGHPWSFNGQHGNVPACTGCVNNSSVASELSSDPTITDVGGNSTVGPRINDPVELFDLQLDCSGMSSSGVYVITLRANAATTPLPTGFGFLYNPGPVLLKQNGAHIQTPVLWGATVLPNDVAFIGVTYTAQGFCSQTGGGRLSDGLIQTIGG
jgi:hypothetical protein